MGYLVKMPKLSMEMESGVLLEWYVGEGETVTEGDLLAEVESEKSIGEIEAYEDGTLRRIYLQEGERTDPGMPIGIVAGVDEDVSDLEAEAEAAGVAVDSAVDADTRPDSGSGDADPSPAVVSAADTDGVDGLVTPAARRRARELDVSLGTIDGTGPKGAITSDDVERAATAESTPAGVEVTPSTPGSNAGGDPRRNDASPRARRLASEVNVDIEHVDGSGPDGAVLAADVERAAEVRSGATRPPVVEERELSSMRQTISDRLGRSYREAVHVTHQRTVDAEGLVHATKVAASALETDVSLLDVLLVALSETLSEHPEFNATFEDDRYRLYADQNVGIAVDVNDGLVAPVLTDIGPASIEEIAQRRRALTDRTLAGDYTMDDLTGGTFTVTNLGPFGIEAFTPVINPPQVAILGVNTIEEKPVRDGDDVAFRDRLPLSLSFDHRVLDGADAARFLETLADQIENAEQLLVVRGA